MQSARRRVTRDYSFTRPNDTNAYATNDAISDATSTATLMSWAQVARGSGFGGTVTGVTVIKSTVGVVALDFDLFLFDTAPASFEDNAAFDPSDAEMKRCVGFVEFLAADAGIGTVNAVWTKTQLGLNFEASDDTMTLWGVLVARGAHTPSAQDVFTVRLQVEMD